MNLSYFIPLVVQKLAFGPQQKLSRLNHRKRVHITNMDPFAMIQLEGFGSAQMPIFESQEV